MGYQPVTNVASVEAVHWNGKSYSENVLHYKAFTPWTEQKLRDLAIAYKAHWTATHKTSIPATIFLAKIIVKDLSSQSGPGIEYSDGLPLPGDSTAAPLPMSVTAAVKLTTGKRGRSYRGRSYFIGLTEELVAGDTLDVGFQQALKSYYEDLLLVKIDPLDQGWVVVSRWNNGAPRITGEATIITGVEVDGAVDSQRRRLLGRGW